MHYKFSPSCCVNWILSITEKRLPFLWLCRNNLSCWIGLILLFNYLDLLSMFIFCLDVQEEILQETALSVLLTIIDLPVLDGIANSSDPSWKNRRSSISQQSLIYFNFNLPHSSSSFSAENQCFRYWLYLIFLYLFCLEATVSFAAFCIVNFWVFSMQNCQIIYVDFEHLSCLYTGLPSYVLIFIVYLVLKVIRGFKLHRIACQQFLEAKIPTLESSALTLLQQNLGCPFRRRFSSMKL